MADINQLIEPITPSNTVNSINIYKVDYSDLWSASASYLPNVYVNPRKIKGTDRRTRIYKKIAAFNKGGIGDTWHGHTIRGGIHLSIVS